MTTKTKLKDPAAKPDIYARTEEMSRFDVLDGPFVRFFHIFFRRRAMTPVVLKPYPFFIGGVHRMMRMLDVADPWELVVLALMPVVIVLVYNMHRWFGVSNYLVAYGVILVCCYFGYYMVVWVFLDRRLDKWDLMRVRSIQFERTKAREARLTRRQEQKRARREIAARSAAAQERGVAKSHQLADDDEWDDEAPAAPRPPDGPPPVPLSLDELLRPE